MYDNALAQNKKCLPASNFKLLRHNQIKIGLIPKSLAPHMFVKFEDI